MSNENGPSNDRRGSVTSAAFSNLFQRSNSTSTGNNGRESVTSVAARDQRRRLSVTTIGLGTSPNAQSAPFGIRRGSISTNNSDSIDENAIDDEESAKAGPNSPFARRMSFGAQAMRNLRTGPTSPGTAGRHSQESRRISNGHIRAPPTGAPSASAAARRASTSQASHTFSYRIPSDVYSARADNAYNWSEQLRSRAESSVQGHRPSFGAGRYGSPPRGNGQHDRAKSVSEMPAPPQQAATVKPKQPERPKPDHMQERILKGDFYMD
ncbi:uncharacterized protein GGS22DRAFT_3698 [Annulohypoxylon maeteangense]|uniref:uncharacterized protein n=1 Tax=Annulohypoxylon maeteangense TaxID=1927788 RepID=UPI002007AC8D|nr:uncharacterized protein GGS22DRAFT_3698 [Annulohypoxylon maeteangense]KAI0889756.1 hypothetical protein GGS22DRAFT_3698 [Annulohypoxylon maeteangense]